MVGWPTSLIAKDGGLIRQASEICWHLFFVEFIRTGKMNSSLSYPLYNSTHIYY